MKKKTIKRVLAGAIAVSAIVAFSLIYTNTAKADVGGGDKIYCYSDLGNPPRLRKVVGCVDCNWVKANNPSLLNKCTRNAPAR